MNSVSDEAQKCNLEVEKFLHDISNDQQISRRVMKLERIPYNESQVYVVREPPLSGMTEYHSKYSMNNTQVQTIKNDSEVTIVKKNSDGYETFANKKNGSNHTIQDRGDSIDIQITPYEKPIELSIQNLDGISIREAKQPEQQNHQREQPETDQVSYDYLKQKIQERIDQTKSLNGAMDQLTQDGFQTDDYLPGFKTMQHTTRKKKVIKSSSQVKLPGRKKSAYSTVTHDNALSNIYADLMENQKREFQTLLNSHVVKKSKTPQKKSKVTTETSKSKVMNEYNMQQKTKNLEIQIQALNLRIQRQEKQIVQYQNQIQMEKKTNKVRMEEQKKYLNQYKVETQMKYDADLAQKDFQIKQLSNKIESLKGQLLTFDHKSKENETLVDTLNKSMQTFNKHKDQIAFLTCQNEKLQKIVDKAPELQLKETQIKYEMLKDKYQALKSGKLIEAERSNISICSIKTLQNDLTCQVQIWKARCKMMAEKYFEVIEDLKKELKNLREMQIQANITCQEEVKRVIAQKVPQVKQHKKPKLYGQRVINMQVPADKQIRERLEQDKSQNEKEKSYLQQINDQLQKSNCQLEKYISQLEKQLESQIEQQIEQQEINISQQEPLASTFQYVMTELNSSYSQSPERPPEQIFNVPSLTGLLQSMEKTIVKTDEYLHKPNFSRLESKDLETISKNSKQNSDLNMVMISDKKQELINIKKQLEMAKQKMTQKQQNIKERIQKYGQIEDSPSV